jgi:Siphovirus Gp157
MTPQGRGARPVSGLRDCAIGKSFIVSNEANAFAFLRNQIEALKRDIPNLVEDEKLWIDTLDGETNFNEFMGRLIRLDAEAKAISLAMVSIAEDYTQRAGRFKRRSEWLRGLMHGALQAAALPSLKLPEGTITERQPCAKLEILDANELPQGYFEIERVPEKAALKKALEAGEKIPGAALVFGDASITVRVK